MDGDSHDWELLHESDIDSIESQASDEKSSNSSEVDGVSFGVFRTDHFSVGNLVERSGKSTDPSGNEFVKSDDSDRVDSSWSESSTRRKNPGSFPAESSFDQSDEYGSSNAFVRNELEFIDGSLGGAKSKTEILAASEPDGVKQSNLEVVDAEHAESQGDVEETGKTLDCDEDLSKRSSDSGIPKVSDGKHFESHADVEETGKTLACDDDSSKCLSDSGIPEVSDRKHFESQAAAGETGKTLPCNEDSGGEVLVSGDSGATTKENEFVSNSGLVSSKAMVGNEVRIVEREAHSVNLEARTGDERKKSGMVWWKMPFVLLKYCGFKIGPIWTVSLATAVMGLALLGRRFYNLKKKSRRFQLKVTIDDKKVSRVMSQAARLNEAFTEVRRVPVIRPALPSPGANPWPVLSLR